MYNTLGIDFKIDERFLSPANQRVTEELIDRIYNESGGIYSVKDIKRNKDIIATCMTTIHVYVHVSSKLNNMYVIKSLP